MCFPALSERLGRVMQVIAVNPGQAPFSCSGMHCLAEQVSSTLSDTLGSAGSALLRATSLRRSVSADEDAINGLMREPCSDSISMKYFEQPGSAGFKVRGHNYLQDKKKVCWVLCRPRLRISCDGCRACSSGKSCGSFQLLATACTSLRYDMTPTALLHQSKSWHAFQALVPGSDDSGSMLRAAMHGGQYEPDAPAMTLGSVNLINQKRHTFHIARFLPSIRDSPAPFTFVWQVGL